MACAAFHCTAVKAISGRIQRKFPQPVTQNTQKLPETSKGPFPLQSQFAKRMRFANSEFK